MFFGNLKRVFLNLVGVGLVRGPCCIPMKAPANRHRRSSKRNQGLSPNGPEKKLEVPAPRDLKVAGGRGKYLIFDSTKKRIEFAFAPKIRRKFKEIERKCDGLWSRAPSITARFKSGSGTKGELNCPRRESLLARRVAATNPSEKW